MTELSAVADAVFTADIDDDYSPLPDEVEETEEPEAQEEEETPEEPETPDKVTALERKLEEATKEINRLGYALRKDKEPKKEKEAPAFTKSQLLALYKENADNPEVAFQIMDEMTKLGKADAQLAAEKSTEVKQKLFELDDHLSKMYPEAKKEGSELHSEIQKAVEWAHLDGHPFAEHLAFGLLALKNLPETIQQVKEAAKAEALKTKEKDLAEKTEKARKSGIAASRPTGSGKVVENKSASLSATQLDTLKRMVGGTPSKMQIERYAKMMGAKRETMHSEA
jgi:uncharacterized pyridoxamine 5'-phosphate oxidase family protein